MFRGKGPNAGNPGNPFIDDYEFIVPPSSPTASSQPYLQSEPARNGEGEQQQQEPQETDEAMAEAGGPALRRIWGQKNRNNLRTPAGPGRTTLSTMSQSTVHHVCVLHVFCSRGSP